ncbi:MAG: hypothetical protein U9M90_01680 [Patescibacteria group bacterium]|nr:hypothetical protein [Patescibacteria group bacterium]
MILKIQKRNKMILWGLILVFAFGVAGAALGSYTTHEEIPGQGTTSDFPIFLKMLYNFSIGIVAILAIIMVGVGAFTYIVTSAGNASKMADGKDMIYSALTGLAIALVAYITLFLINPDLISGTIEAVSTIPQYIDPEHAP